MTNSEIKKAKFKIKKQLNELAAKVVEYEKGVKIGNVIKIGKWAVIESINVQKMNLEKIIISVKYLSPHGGFQGYTWLYHKHLQNDTIFACEDSWRKSMQEKISLRKTQK